jgi:hypothetical protein
MFRNNTTGINVQNVGPGSAAGGPPANLSYATVAASFFIGNVLRGLLAQDNSRIAVSDSVFAANGVGVGAYANADYSFSEVNLDRCTMSRNGNGIQAGDGSGSQLPHGYVRLANCMITGNDIGVSTSSNGFSLSRLSNGVYTNTIEGNGSNGTPSGMYNAK